ncbi:ExcA, partial [Klebsiella pneumoniae]
DMDSGVVGIAALYAVQASIKQKRILFEAETIESWEYTDSKLVVNLRNRHVPTVEIILLNAGAAYRQLEMLTRMHEQHKKYRGEKYLQWRKTMLDEGWMLPRTY